MYKIYLRTSDQRVAEKANTHSQARAMEIFSKMVDRTRLDGQKFEALLSHENRQLALHKFDSQPGGQNYWRGRFDKIDLPLNPVGAPRQIDRGRRVNVYLDQESLKSAATLGKGNVSEGIRIALRNLNGNTVNAEEFSDCFD